nr:MAG TPA: hypothetical protein [Caudoviricetes sp.]
MKYHGFFERFFSMGKTHENNPSTKSNPLIYCDIPLLS